MRVQYQILFLIFAKLSSQFSRAVTPDFKGFFYGPTNKDATSWGDTETASEALLKDLTPGKVASLICHHDKKYGVMSKTLASNNVASAKPKSAEEILNELRSQDLPELRQHLMEMAFEYLVNEDDRDYRDAVYSSFLSLDAVLMDVEHYHCFNSREDE